MRQLYHELLGQGFKPDSPVVFERISRTLTRHTPQSIRSRLKTGGLEAQIDEFAREHGIAKLFAISLLWSYSGDFSLASRFLKSADRRQFQPAPWSASDDRLLLKGRRTRPDSDRRKQFLEA